MIFLIEWEETLEKHYSQLKKGVVERLEINNINVSKMAIINQLNKGILKEAELYIKSQFKVSKNVFKQQKIKLKKLTKNIIIFCNLKRINKMT